MRLGSLNRSGGVDGGSGGSRSTVGQTHRHTSNPLRSRPAVCTVRVPSHACSTVAGKEQVKEARRASAGLWGCEPSVLQADVHSRELMPCFRFSVVLRTGNITPTHLYISRHCFLAVSFNFFLAVWFCMALLMQMASNTKYSKGMMSGPYNPRPRLIDPKLVPAARKGLSAPWAVFSLSCIYVYLPLSPSICPCPLRGPLARIATRSPVRVHTCTRSCICRARIPS